MESDAAGYSCQERWQADSDQIHFAFGGRSMGSTKLRVLILARPFTRPSSQLEESSPPWRKIPAGFTAAVVPAQPIGMRLKHLT